MTLLGLELVAAAIGGLIVGSFLNVVIHRLPRGESVIRPRSRCPGCAVSLRTRDNVPVLSWLALRGSCHACATPISPRYPLVEGTTAALFVAVVLASTSTVDIALGLLAVCVLMPVALIDLDHRIIPNRLLLPAAVGAVVVGTLLDPGGEPGRLIAGAAAGSFLLVAALAYPGGMGMGDVKLAAVIGLLLGVAVAAAILIALVLGVLVGVVIMSRRGVSAGRRTAVPFGPMLSAGGLVGVLAGASLVSWYLGTFA